LRSLKLLAVVHGRHSDLRDDDAVRPQTGNPCDHRAESVDDRSLCREGMSMRSFRNPPDWSL
jgi:hypothetical protein